MNLNLYRNQDGFIELDKINIEEIGPESECASLSDWLLFPDGNKYLFKWSNNPNFYEIYCALVEEQAAKSLGIKSAEYDLAVYKGRVGIISKNFLKDDEKLITGAQILNESSQKKSSKFRNNVKDVYSAMNIYFDNKEITDSIMYQFIIGRYMFDIALCEQDGIAHNWGIIHNTKTNEYSWANRYDSDMMAGSQNGEEYINNKLKENRLPDGSLNIEKIKDVSNWFHSEISYDSKRLPVSYDFKNFCEENLELTKKGFEIFCKLDIKKVFESVEAKIGARLPSDYKLWISTIVNIRIEIMSEIIKDLENVNKL